MQSFSQVLQFQVKPDKTDAFEKLIETIRTEQKQLDGCLDVKYLKRFYLFEDVKSGNPPKQISKVVKCVRYYAFLDFDTIENCGKAVAWLFNHYEKEIMKLLISPFDIMSGYAL